MVLRRDLIIVLKQCLECPEKHFGLHHVGIPLLVDGLEGGERVLVELES